VQRGDGVRFPEAQRPQVRGVRLAALAVHLVRAQHDGLPGLAQQPDDGLVGVRRADLGVHDEDDGVGRLDRVLGLRGHRRVDAEDVLLPAAGVDDLETPPGPLGLIGDAVAGHPRLVLDDGLAAADDPVDERRLADVRPPDHGQHRQRPVPGLLDGPFDVLDVEALFRGKLHELRVLGVTERSVLVLGVVVVVHEVPYLVHRGDRWMPCLG